MNAECDDVGSEDALDDFYAALLDDDPVKLYDRAPCGYLSTTPDGTIVKVNQTFLSLTGYERSSLVGRRTFSELLTPGGRIYHETHYAPMLRLEGSAKEIALDLVRADGSRLPVLVNSAVERTPDGDPIVVRTAVFDATDRRAYERELLAAKERAEVSEQRAVLLARTLARSFIPPTPPTIPGLLVNTAFRPAGDGGDLGGDFYDVFEVGTGDWVIVIGDVRGKGVDAAVVTTLARHVIRAASVQSRTSAEVLLTLNDVLLRDETDRFCTACVVRLARSGQDWTADIALGGHPRPVLVSRDGTVRPVGRPGTLLGLFDDVSIEAEIQPLAPGDRLVAYTDGVTEARSGDDFYGDDRVLAAIAAATGASGSIAEALATEALAFQQGHPHDDIAVVEVAVPVRA